MLEDLKTLIDSDIAAIATKRSEAKVYLENRQTIESNMIRDWVLALRAELKKIDTFFVIQNAGADFNVYSPNGDSLLINIKVNIFKVMVTNDPIFVPRIRIQFGKTEYVEAIEIFYNDLTAALTDIQNYLRKWVVYSKTGEII